MDHMAFLADLADAHAYYGLDLWAEAKCRAKEAGLFFVLPYRALFVFLGMLSGGTGTVRFDFGRLLSGPPTAQGGERE